MKKLTQTVALLSFCCLAANVLQAAPSAAPSTPPKTLFPHPVKNQSELDLSISKKADLPEGGCVLTCVFANKADRDISLNLEAHSAFRVVIDDAKGKKITLVASPKLRLPPGVLVPIAAGKTLSFDLSVNRENYKVPAAGAYPLQVVYESIMQKLNGTAVWYGHVESNSVQATFK